MKSRNIICLLIAGPLLISAAGASAASLEESSGSGSSSRTGAFAGARVRLALGERSGAKRDTLRAGLAVAPVRQNYSASGRSRSFYGAGLEFGFSSVAPIGFSLAGQPLRRAPEERKRGVSTLGKVAIGAGLALVITVAVLYAVTQEALNDPQD